MLKTVHSEIRSLLALSARLGSNPLLVQAATGNTSIKLGGTLWIKASGKWLAHACQEEIFIPVDVAETKARIARNSDPAGQYVFPGKPLRTSTETAMHAIIPHRVVLHVHSVDVIAWAVRRDASAVLAACLEGLHWKWIPYVVSGLPLAREIERALRESSGTDVFVLGNHGLVVCGSDCESAEALLDQVQSRVAIAPRETPPPDYVALERTTANWRWRIPEDASVHNLATDPVCRGILSGGTLYPCQAIFLATPVSGEPFLIVERAGVLVEERISPPAYATLLGLAEVLRRLDPSAPIRYLTSAEVDTIVRAGTYQYRELVEANAMRPSGLAAV